MMNFLMEQQQKCNSVLYMFQFIGRLGEKAKSEVQSITSEEYSKLCREGVSHTLIDVREQEEWDAGHVDEAVHIPRGLLEFKIEDIVPDKDALIILQCASGGRGELCGQTLQKMGYTQVKNFEGGYAEYCKSME